MFNLKRNGGPEGARTPDLIHAMDALFQLRYRPKNEHFIKNIRD
jgi:hypothetical protein